MGKRTPGETASVSEAPPPGPLPKSGWRVVQRVRVPVKHSLSSVKSYGKECVCRKVPIAERPLLFGREREENASLREAASLTTPIMSPF